MKTSTILFCIALMAAPVCQAFDGRHKGLVVGVGGGVGVWQYYGASFAQLGGAVSILLGYGFGDRDLIFWEPEYSIWPTRAAKDNPNLVFVVDLYQALTWQHYWMAKKKLFTNIGGFVSHRAVGYGGWQYDYSCGVGYEFTKHMSASLRYNGKAHSNNLVRRADMVMVFVSFVLY